MESNNKIRVYWDDLPENYTKELKNRVVKHFSTKYNVDKNNINVVFRASKMGEDGELISVNDAGIDNIMDINYQRELMKEWLNKNDKQLNFEIITKLDDKVNKEVDFNPNEIRHRRWGLNWLEINNFLCFGSDNKINFERLNGLNIVNSLPENQGGKTTFNVDAIKFLLFGNTTKTDKNEEIFNTYRDEDVLSVKGELDFSPRNIIIERLMSRKEKRGGGWTVSNKVTYYSVMPDGSTEELNGEDAKATTQLIIDSIGKESDFDITTLATANNLENLIESKPTENGKLLNRFIGLEIIDDKLKAVRGLYNTFNAKKLSNTYDVITLNEEVEDLGSKKVILGDLIITHENTLVEAKEEILEYNTQKDGLLSSKISIDDSLLSVNTDTLESELDDISVKGKNKKVTKGEITNELKILKGIKFDEVNYHDLKLTETNNKSDIRSNEKEIVRLDEERNSLELGEICTTCKRPLEGVDNKVAIKDNKEKVKSLIEEKDNLIKANETLEDILKNLNLDKIKVDKRDKLELSLDKIEVELGSLRNKHIEVNNLLKSYNLNKDSIIKNREIDNKVTQIKTKIIVVETKKEDTITKISNIKNEIINIDKDVLKKKSDIIKINKEREVEKIYKLYIDMYGKKGIGKMVLRSVLPIINSELERLMEDICDFVIELEINEKNDVEYVIIKDGVRKLLKSGSGLEKTIASIALRSVLGKMAYLPMPNFITFDEVLGKVAEINIEKMQAIFEKIKELYKTVFFISHNPIVKDWGDNIITVKKENNVSTLNIK